MEISYIDVNSCQIAYNLVTLICVGNFNKYFKKAWQVTKYAFKIKQSSKTFKNNKKYVEVSKSISPKDFKQDVSFLHYNIS